MERREIAGQASLGWTATIGSAIARQSAKEDDSDSEGVPDLTEREMSSSDEEEAERDEQPIAYRRQKNNEPKQEVKAANQWKKAMVPRVPKPLLDDGEGKSIDSGRQRRDGEGSGNERRRRRRRRRG